MTRKARTSAPTGGAAPATGSPAPPTTFAEAYALLNPRQRKFVSFYLQRPNATRAAQKAGYSKKTAYSIGSENLNKPEIKTALRLGWIESGAGPEEVRARTEEVMRADLADVCRFERELHRPMTWVPVRKLLTDLQEDIAFEEEYANRALLDDDQLKAHAAGQVRRRDQALRYEIQLERNPKAEVWAPGPPEIREVAIADIAVARDRGLSHLIRKTKYSPSGALTVELYDGQHARELMGKFHGLWGKDEEGPDAPPGLPEGTGLEEASDEQLAGELSRLLGEDAQ
ncbi:hypothetical protein GO986_17945 [Deinococcus sp. HMF7620]|uniref:Terminase small subunit n=1 Tax=Deinococcus arboris TaxID=2682977 RepID=A0A7C9LT02_9DEIO|nr:terminase small subunit [Deinococcus arboris]MVN88621.1 hypothetical protein [Deinococcus arboris]